MQQPSFTSLKRRILVADDSSAVRDVVRTFLEKQGGFEVCGEAVDGVDTIEKARQLDPDLILLDLAMPRMNGVEAASVLKNTMPHVPVVLFTRHEESLAESLTSAIGVKAVISKQDGITSLVECLKSLLEPA